ncbi:TonB-dependent hemoglobin/transferrin/lactoferrin family receptor [Sessilibacter corallicola]|uniref:TonB-dependent hemoglobin/transferrin/lactoferrin family receptor n=1 Tax=Sessilibacter corallicola TaxID=2904075 RepID=UPI001E309454|nr:TonB-dependent hemoglobin/transferrin/lactoferrin family receptor [Sessilibacter corallicola]MCE2029837.1 TonB-dependent hemoglobin/transferrin/lactoferrin family receptor [Sessilibacter corallicola]
MRKTLFTRIQIAQICFISAGLSSVPLTASAENLETVTVLGTRTERSINDIDATVSVITEKQIKAEIARNISDVIRFEPGVSTGGTGSRFGIDGVNIRGIGANRVLMLVDGVRTPEEFSFGPFLSSRRDFVDVASLSRVEIARGPISSLYGSDALGGVVAFTTKKPFDYLNEKNIYSDISTGFDSANEGISTSVSLAGGNEKIAGLIHYTYRDHNETDTFGGNSGLGADREEADPQEIESNNFNAKIQFKPSESHQFYLNVESFDSDSDSVILSDFTPEDEIDTTDTDINRRTSDDTKERQAFSVNYQGQYSTALLDRVNATAYWQNSESEQDTFDLRTTTSQQSRIRTAEFEQEIIGFNAQFDKSFAINNSNHSLIYGIDYYQTESESMRFGSTTDVATGAPVFEFFPFPTRDFPITETIQYAVFIQDEIKIGKLTITPSIRYDDYSADVQPDAIFFSGNPGSPEPEDYDDQEVTKRLGFVYDIDDQWTTYARYSEGFRAPPYDDVNVGFSNLIGGYKTISNPNLESEYSQGFELGLRFSNSVWNAQLAVFKNDYDDFIESFAIAPQFASTFGVDPADGLLTFQSINLDEVEIEGVELKVEADLEQFSNALSGFTLKTSIAYADGEDKQTGEPIDSVDPLSAVFGLKYAKGAYGGSLLFTAVEGKDDNDISDGSGIQSVGGYGIVDLIANINLTQKLSLDFGIYNLTDKRYIRWADARTIGTDAPGRFTQPEINSRVNLTWEF